MKKAAILFMILFIFCKWNAAQAEIFSMPETGALYIQAYDGEAGAVTEIGIGTSPETHISLIEGLPENPTPTTEVFVGSFQTGDPVVFSMRTIHIGTEYWAFSNDTVNDSSRYAFMDINNSLGWGGNVVEQISQYQWIMHLDDAASYRYDDDDDDVLITLRLDPVPEPCTVLLLGLGGMLIRKR